MRQGIITDPVIGDGFRVVQRRIDDVGNADLIILGEAEHVGFGVIVLGRILIVQKPEPVLFAMYFPDLVRLTPIRPYLLVLHADRRGDDITVLILFEYILPVRGDAIAFAVKEVVEEQIQNDKQRNRQEHTYDDHRRMLVTVKSHHQPPSS